LRLGGLCKGEKGDEWDGKKSWLITFVSLLYFFFGRWGWKGVKKKGGLLWTDGKMPSEGLFRSLKRNVAGPRDKNPCICQTQKARRRKEEGEKGRKENQRAEKRDFIHSQFETQPYWESFFFLRDLSLSEVKDLPIEAILFQIVCL